MLNNGGKKGRTMNAVKTYNELMELLGRDYNTIGTEYSESTAGWNIRDMVSEVQFLLDMWNNPNTLVWADAHDTLQPQDKPWYKAWRNEKSRMERFIKRYRGEAMKTECTERHFSMYD